MTPDTPAADTAATNQKKPAASPYPLSAHNESAVKTMREELGASKLGHLGRRTEMLLRDAQESSETYGAKVFMAKLGDQQVNLPVRTTFRVGVDVECNGITKSYDFVVGANGAAPPVRPEAPLTDFP